MCIHLKESTIRHKRMRGKRVSMATQGLARVQSAELVGQKTFRKMDETREENGGSRGLVLDELAGDPFVWPQ